MPLCRLPSTNSTQLLSWACLNSCWSRWAASSLLACKSPQLDLQKIIPNSEITPWKVVHQGIRVTLSKSLHQGLYTTIVHPNQLDLQKIIPNSESHHGRLYIHQGIKGDPIKITPPRVVHHYSTSQQVG